MSSLQNRINDFKGSMRALGINYDPSKESGTRTVRLANALIKRNGPTLARYGFPLNQENIAKLNGHMREDRPQMLGYWAREISRGLKAQGGGTTKAPSKPKVKKIPIEKRDITVPGYPKPKMVKKPTLVKPSYTPKTPKAPRPKAKATSYKVVKPAKYTVKKVAVKPTPKVVRAPAKAPASKGGGTSKPKKTMTAEHKAKIAKGVKKHHADCKKAMAMMKSKK